MLPIPKSHRPVAFSNKKKKEQLKAKREKKKFSAPNVDKPFFSEKNFSKPQYFEKEKIFASSQPRNLNLSQHSKCGKSYYLDNEEIQEGGAASNKYNVKFQTLHKKREDLRKLQYEPVSPLPEEELEVNSEIFYPPDLDYPKRPAWKKDTSKEELDRIENRSFRLFREDIYKMYDEEQLSLYELNLEFWRQLWRVTEMSDIVLIVVDARFVAAQFPPYLYKDLVEKKNKGVIMVMNKCDLIPSSLVVAWKDFCKEHYPKLIVVPFSSFEGKLAKKSTQKLAKQSSLNLIDACQSLVDDHINLNLWRKKVDEESDESVKVQTEICTEVKENYPVTYQRYKDNILTIGTIGHPNVGKSSLINALMGKKVVSVSKTPGHTKYFQTIFIAKNVKLCDCPGLVFPSLCPRQLQIVSGSYPIAQVSDTLSSIYYIACRIDMPKILHLKAGDVGEESDDFLWTPFHICEAWAKKRSYYIRTKGAKPDVFRAANELLRLTAAGLKGLIISLKPHGYFKNKDLYESDSRINEVMLIQNMENNIGTKLPSSDEESSEELSSEEDTSVDSFAFDVASSDSDDVDVNDNKFALLSLENTSANFESS